MKKLHKICKAMLVATTFMMLTGCGKTKPEDIINKYSEYCELGEYKGVEYTTVDLSADEEDVQNQIEAFLSGYAEKVDLVDGDVVEMGDYVSIDFDGYIDGQYVENASTQGQPVYMELGQELMIPGFEEQIAGHKIGEEFDIDVTFPEVYENNPDMAGKDAIFTITIHQGIHTAKPELTDEFVAANTDFATVEEFKAAILEQLTSQYAESVDSYYKSSITTTVIENATIKEYPQKDMEDMLEDTMDDVESQAKDNNMTTAEYIEARYGYRSEEAFRDYLVNAIQDFMTEKIVICAVAKDAGITVSKDEIEAYKQEMMDTTGYSEKEFDDAYPYSDVVYYALADKVVTYLQENATPVAPEAE